MEFETTLSVLRATRVGDRGGRLRKLLRKYLSAALGEPHATHGSQGAGRPAAALSRRLGDPERDGHAARSERHGEGFGVDVGPGRDDGFVWTFTFAHDGLLTPVWTLQPFEG